MGFSQDLCLVAPFPVLGLTEAGFSYTSLLLLYVYAYGVRQWHWLFGKYMDDKKKT